MSPIGRIFAALGGVLVVVGAFLPWVGSTGAQDDRSLDIALGWAVGLTDDRVPALVVITLAAGLVVGSVFIIVGAYLGSPSIAGVGSAVVLVLVVLWEIREIQDRGGSAQSVSDLTLGGTLGPGALLALAGGLLALFAALVLRERRQEVLPTTL